jgi:methanogenic corrinoid protein MtbC1
MLAVLVSQAGWSVTYLGAETPATAWEEAIRTLDPQVVVVAATMPAHAPVVLETLQRLQECFGRQAPQLAYGGPAFAAAPLEAGAATPFIRLADDLESAVRQLTAYG